MKKIFALMAIVAIAFVSCKKDEETTTNNGNGGSGGGANNTITVEEKNMGLYNKLTATWCGPCGQWGWTLNESITADLDTNAVFMSTYASTTSDMYNSTAAAFKAVFSPSSGWPDFCSNGKQMTQFSSSGGINTARTHDSVIAVIERHVNDPVMANSGYKTSWSGDTLTIKTKMQFFQTMPSASYYLGAYLIEDGVLNYQNGQSGTPAHHHVLRASAHTSAWGELISTPSTAGSTFEHTFTYVVPSNWVKSNIEVATVIWKKVGSSYSFVNAFKEI